MEWIFIEVINICLGREGRGAALATLRRGDGGNQGGDRGEAVIMVHVQLPAASEGNSEFQMPSVASGTKDKLMMQAEAAPPRPPPLAYRGLSKPPPPSLPSR